MDTPRQQRYRVALEGADLSGIPESIEREFIQGDAGRIDVMEGHAQVAAFLTAALSSEDRLDTSVEGVPMGLFLTMSWLTKSLERLADFETVSAKMQREVGQ